MEDKSWDYLFSHHNSPLVAYGSTIYFQHLEDMPAARQLGISRSTLWRYLGRCAEKKPARADEQRE